MYFHISKMKYGVVQPKEHPKLWVNVCVWLQQVIIDVCVTSSWGALTPAGVVPDFSRRRRRHCRCGIYGTPPIRSVGCRRGRLGRSFCIIEKVEFGMPQGSFRREPADPSGFLFLFFFIFIVLDEAKEKKTENELMKTVLMSAKNNMKVWPESFIILEQTFKITSKECTLFRLV